MAHKWLALALSGALMGCYIEPFPEDSLETDFPEPPQAPQVPEPSRPRPGGTLTETGTPDFELESVTGPSLLGKNSQSTVRARVCNRGDGSGGVEAAFYLSEDTFLDTGDTWVATSSSTTVSAGGCRDVSTQVKAAASRDGRYFLLAKANQTQGGKEQVQSNNVGVGAALQVDVTAPAAPVLSWVSGTETERNPKLSAHAEAYATVRIYRGGSCAGTPVADGSSGTGTSCEIVVPASTYPASNYSARVYDAAGNASGCSSLPAPYSSDTTPPPAPALSEASWQYGTREHALRVSGSTEAGAEVGIFIDVACQDIPAATVFADSRGLFTANLTVAASSAGSIRRVYVAARDAAYNESSCVEGPPYETPCPPGYANCDGNPANGCEVNLTEDAANCGTCGTSCQSQGNAMGVCVAGTCGTACPVGAYDCDGNPANGCESYQACDANACVIDRSAELIITALPVVEDPVRTAPGGAWHFGTLVKAMAGEQDASAMVRQWLKTWSTAQTINGFTVPARPQMMTKVLGPWEQKSGGANRPLDFSKAPFRLLAIVNRMDLRQPGVQAGEGRFVFGVLDDAGKPLEFTVILEYALPGGTPEAIQRWARDWHELGQLGLNHPQYKAKLQALTDRFAKAGVMAGRPFGNALNQLRTNEVELSQEWEMREFTLTETGLRPATVKLTPDFSFNNTTRLGDYLRANETDVLAEQHHVPESFAGVRFLAGASAMPEKFFWRAPGVGAEVRHRFSLNTCSGCHAGETGTDFTHIAPREAGRAAVLSAFLRGGTVRDPVTAATRSFDDLGRRAEDMAVLVCGTSTPQRQSAQSFDSFPASSNLPRARVH